MHGCASWILKAAPGERSWFNPNAARKGGGLGFYLPMSMQDLLQITGHYTIIGLYGLNLNVWREVI